MAGAGGAEGVIGLAKVGVRGDGEGWVCTGRVVMGATSFVGDEGRRLTVERQSLSDFGGASSGIEATGEKKGPLSATGLVGALDITSAFAMTSRG
jgi:hypothetical protein